MVWYVYIILCENEKLYTGITTNLARRFEEHKSGKKGAKFFRTTKPLKIVYREEFSCRSSASKRELTIKRMKRAQKEKLFNSIGP